MSEKVVTPVFLTEDIAKSAVYRAIQVLRDLAVLRDLTPTIPFSVLKCHVVILVPSKTATKGENESSFPGPVTKPRLLYEQSFGGNWPHDFKKIARSKAQQLWDGRNDGRTDCQPHLLFPEETPWYGGVKMDGIVVTCSGFESYFDVMVSTIVAAMLIGLSYHAWASIEKDFNDDFLPLGEGK